MLKPNLLVKIQEIQVNLNSQLLELLYLEEEESKVNKILALLLDLLMPLEMPQLVLLEQLLMQDIVLMSFRWVRLEK